MRSNLFARRDRFGRRTFHQVTASVDIHKMIRSIKGKWLHHRISDNIVLVEKASVRKMAQVIIRWSPDNARAHDILAVKKKRVLSFISFKVQNSSHIFALINLLMLL